MVGTAFPSIGLVLASAVGAARAVEDDRTLVLASGNGGFLRSLSDLEILEQVPDRKVAWAATEAPGMRVLWSSRMWEAARPRCS